MAKALFIAEKPSVAREFAKALKYDMEGHDGYLESPEVIVTWCVGHLVTMSYPESYDVRMKHWSLRTLPFLPKEFKYEVIPDVKKQYQTVAGLLNRKDVGIIYVCTDSGREGEYIYRLVEQMAGVTGKERRRVWIDSQTEEEILRGIREAKDLSEYDNLSESAYLRAKEDYLIGINFSRLLTLKYGQGISDFLHTKRTVISVGRVMTCVLGMVVRREREIRAFVKTPFYRVLSVISIEEQALESEWRATEGSAWFASPKLYRENGFREEADARSLADALGRERPLEATVVSIEKKKESKKPPLLYNLAELQNDCSKFFKISPDETLRIAQELYEKKLVTYPRTDARVLSSAVAKEISKNIGGLRKVPAVAAFAEEILEKGSHKSIAKTRYVNDKQITDHYALIPTGQGLGALKGLSAMSLRVYEAIVRRFLAIFYPAAEYQKVSLVTQIGKERFYASLRVLVEKGYLKVMGDSPARKKEGEQSVSEQGMRKQGKSEQGVDGQGVSEQSVGKQGKGEQGMSRQSMDEQGVGEAELGASALGALLSLKPGMVLPVEKLSVKEGETTPPKRYSSGSLILAMENAGQLIEDEELRAQIKGCGIGTSATRAEILKKLVHNKYLSLNKKTQVVTPTLLGEMIHDVVAASIRSLLNPELTASWEKGLNYVAEGSITPQEYMDKLEHFIRSHTEGVMRLENQHALRGKYLEDAKFYRGAS